VQVPAPLRTRLVILTLGVATLLFSPCLIGAAPVPTCADQAPCLRLQVGDCYTPPDETAQYRSACLRWELDRGSALTATACAKEKDSPISHACMGTAGDPDFRIDGLPPDSTPSRRCDTITQVAAGDKWPIGTIELKWNPGQYALLCQCVKVGGTAVFHIKDGVGCGDSATSVDFPIGDGTIGSCIPSRNYGKSCICQDPPDECAWSFPIKECETSPSRMVCSSSTTPTSSAVFRDSRNNHFQCDRPTTNGVVTCSNGATAATWADMCQDVFGTPGNGWTMVGWKGGKTCYSDTNYTITLRGIGNEYELQQSSRAAASLGLPINLGSCLPPMPQLAEGLNQYVCLCGV
jgi:hypothetical protein